MSLLNGSPNHSDPNQTSLNIQKNGNGRTIMDTHNGNGLNNNHDEFKVDMKSNGNDKVAEDDPLTGQKRKIVIESSANRQPRWTKRFASTNFFMVIFLLAYVLQGCYFTYFVSVITTLEKLFHVKSAHIALLLNFSEIGQIFTSLLLAYFAGRGHRPRWIACGMFLFSIAAFGSVSPHFLFGSRLYKSILVAESDGAIVSENLLLPNTTASFPEYKNMCLTEKALKELTSVDPTCEMNTETESNADSLKFWVLGILAVSLLGIGIGQTAIATLGIPYIDDNVKSKQSPLYMAITIGVRVLGPALGYYLGSFCIRLYVDLTMDVDPSAPNFVGAWWLGLIFVSTSMFFTSLIMFTFPKNLRNKTTKVVPAPTTEVVESTKTDKNTSGKLDEVNDRSKLNDFCRTIKRQLKNDILMFRTASAVLHLLPITGLYVFLTKYLEDQFAIATHQATFISGTFGILVMGVGIIITGIISVKFALSARKVALWIAFTALAAALGMFVLSMIGCPKADYSGLQTVKEPGFFTQGSKVFVPPCKSNCTCDNTKYDPICGSDGLTYYSPCHAGCSSQVSKSSYKDCSCMIDELKTAESGKCVESCDRKLQLFVVIFALTVFIHSTSEVGGMLIIMRCTDPQDKVMAMGIVQFSIGLLSNIPCPNIYARIIDAACLVWTKICGKNGHCTLYDSDSFRRNFFVTSCLIMLLAFVMDIVVFFKSHRIDIDPESNTANETTTKDCGEENLLKLRKLSQEGDDEHHMKIPIADEN